MRWGAALQLAGCGACAGDEHRAYEHAQEHPPGHDHHAEGHGHGEWPVVRLTHFGERLEVFLEHPVAVAGRGTQVLGHVTDLRDHSALQGAQIELHVAGPAELSLPSAAASRPGIYRWDLPPLQAGQYRLALQIEVSGWREGHADLELQVHRDEASARDAAKAQHEEEHGAEVDFLKEQQWNVPFATARVGAGDLQPAVEVSGQVETPPGGFAELSAPIAGRVLAPAAGLPRPGQRVKRGQLLVSLAPTPASPEAAARAKLAVVEAEARHAAAATALARAQRLMKDQAVSKRELEEAERELSVSREAVRAARDAQALFLGAKSGRGGGGWRLTAPLAGELVTVRAQPGAAVTAGQVLFQIVDARELWIRARVAEQEASRLNLQANAAYRIAGLTQWTELPAGGPQAQRVEVTVSPAVDPVSRTVDVIYALRDPDPRLRVGGLVRVSLPVGEPFAGLVIPRTAVLDDVGRATVYVQLDGEHFLERPVRLGPVAAGRVGGVSGLSAGERVVVKGAHLVRMASRATGQEPHGHIH